MPSLTVNITYGIAKYEVTVKWQATRAENVTLSLANNDTVQTILHYPITKVVGQQEFSNLNYSTVYHIKIIARNCAGTNAYVETITEGKCSVSMCNVYFIIHSHSWMLYSLCSCQW